METLTTALFDQFPGLRVRRGAVVCVVCLVCFLAGLTMCLEGGIYMFELFNIQLANINLIVIAVLGVVAVHYVFGK